MDIKKSDYIKNTTADPVTENYVRKVMGVSYSYVAATEAPSPKLIHKVDDFHSEWNIDSHTPTYLEIFSGKKKLENSFAMNYGGQQFGQWAGQLGDGRAINLGQLEGWELQIKGAGTTPYSRNADGKAVLRSSIREYLMAEAMHHLNIPTTRSLNLIETGEKVIRDILYNGNSKWEKGAIVTRLAPSFVRFGNFEIHAATKQKEELKALTDYIIESFYPKAKKSPNNYFLFFMEVYNKTLDLVLHWQRTGFVHGVMNTDNISILGLTIDYGPFGMLDEYDPQFTPNTTDFATKRYRYENQPVIMQWNLMQLARALVSLSTENVKLYEDALNEFPALYYEKYIQMMKSKLGLYINDEKDSEFIHDLEALLQVSPTDYTIFFRELSENEENSIEVLRKAFYSTNIPSKKWQKWLDAYNNRIQKEEVSVATRRANMQMSNPRYILRNYMLYLATEAAEKGNYSLIDELFNLIQKPYEYNKEFEKWYVRKPGWADETLGSRFLSCSS